MAVDKRTRGRLCTPAEQRGPTRRRKFGSISNSSNRRRNWLPGEQHPIPNRPNRGVKSVLKGQTSRAGNDVPKFHPVSSDDDFNNSI